MGSLISQMLGSNRQLRAVDSRPCLGTSLWPLTSYCWQYGPLVWFSTVTLILLWETETTLWYGMGANCWEKGGKIYSANLLPSQETSLEPSHIQWICTVVSNRTPLWALCILTQPHDSRYGTLNITALIFKAIPKTRNFGEMLECIWEVSTWWNLTNHTANLSGYPFL